jgi:hypothetical protein
VCISSPAPLYFPLLCSSVILSPLSRERLGKGNIDQNSVMGTGENGVTTHTYLFYRNFLWLHFRFTEALEQDMDVASLDKDAISTHLLTVQAT